VRTDLKGPQLIADAVDGAVDGGAIDEGGVAVDLLAAEATGVVAEGGGAREANAVGGAAVITYDSSSSSSSSAITTGASSGNVAWSGNAETIFGSRWFAIGATTI